MKKLKRNPSALIAFLLLILSAFLFPLFGTSLFGESFSNKSTVIVNLIKDTFTSQINLSSNFGILQLLLVIVFVFIALFYFLNGVGAIYNRYSRYASILTFVYLVIGLITYNALNNEYATSIFGFEISSVSIGAGIYFVPIIGICYLIFARSLNRIIRI